MEREVAASIRNLQAGILERADRMQESSGVNDTSLREYWYQRLDATYWATRKYRPSTACKLDACTAHAPAGSPPP